MTEEELVELEATATPSLIQGYPSTPEFNSRFQSLAGLVPPAPASMTEEELAAPPVEAVPEMATMPLAPTASLTRDPNEEMYLSNAKLSAMGAQMPQAPSGELPANDQPPVASPIKSPVEGNVEPQASPVGNIMSMLSGEPSRQSLVDAAQKARREEMVLADAERLSNIISEGMLTSGGDRAYKPDFSRAEELAKRAELPMQELTEDMKLKPEEQMQDPASPVSAQYRELAGKLLRGKIPEGFDKLSAAQIQKTLPMLQQISSAEKKSQMSPYEQIMAQYRLGMLDKARKTESRLTDKFGHSKTQKFQDDARNTLKDLRSKPGYKEAVTRLDGVERITPLLDDAYEKGGQSLAMLGPTIAKGIAGEVGVLTEADVTRYVKNPALVEGLMDSLLKIKSGQVTKASYDNIKRLMEITKQASKDKIRGLVDDEARLFSRREEIPFEYALQFIDSEFNAQPLQRSAASNDSTAGASSAEKVVVEKDGKQFRLPKAQLDAALKQGYKEVK